jgi:hypothetical protein
MKKLSKEKKTHLTLVGLVTLCIIAGLWFGLITMQQDKIKEIANRSKSVQAEIDKMKKVTDGSSQVKLDLEEATNTLGKIESTMASGDLFSWLVSSIKQFNIPSYKVDMPQFGPPAVGDVRLLPSFPYRQASVTVSGSAYYYDFGKFLADLENHFPYLRVQNVNLEPGLGTNPDDHEKLYFHMEIVTLVKPNAS